MDLEEVRRDLAALRRRLASGEIDEEIYRRHRSLILEDLTAEELRELGTGATPQPGASGLGLRPSGAEGGGIATALPSFSELDLEPGTVLFEQWRIEREIGRGGFGVVFEAHELLLDERQAVKVLDPTMVARSELLTRFRREVALMRRLVHPRIVRVYDYRESVELGQALIGMEYVAGGSVKDLGAAARAARESLPLPLILGILSQMLEALVGAHAQGIIHRDVTPGNVLLMGGPAGALLADPSRDPGAKLVDFGIAALAERSELSQKSRVLGTVAYVAPEILDPAADEPRRPADIYGCGAVVYELLTGEPPVGRFELPSVLRPDVPEPVEELVMHMLDRHPQRRPSAEGAARRCREIMSPAGSAVEREEREEPRPAEEARPPEEAEPPVEPAEEVSERPREAEEEARSARSDLERMEQEARELAAEPAAVPQEGEEGTVSRLPAERGWKSGLGGRLLGAAAKGLAAAVLLAATSLRYWEPDALAEFALRFSPYTIALGLGLLVAQGVERSGPRIGPRLAAVLVAGPIGPVFLSLSAIGFSAKALVIVVAMVWWERRSSRPRSPLVRGLIVGTVAGVVLGTIDQAFGFRLFWPVLSLLGSLLAGSILGLLIASVTTPRPGSPDES